MQKNWFIRKAVPADAGLLKSCMESAYAAYQERFEGTRLPPMDADYSAEIDNYPVWVVEAAGSIAGGLVMVFEKKCALIANIAVDPEYQGQGIGGALMEFAEDEARSRDFSELHLATHLLLSENIALYQHLGWHEVGRDETRIFMKKVIKKP